MQLLSRRVRGLMAAALLGAAIANVALADSLNVNLGSGVYIELLEIQPGTFTQGSPDDEPGRKPEEVQREVTLTKAFFIGKVPVTRAQFARFVAETNYRTEAEKGSSGGFGWTGQLPLVQKKEFTWKNPGFAQTGDHPVTIVTYADAKAFLAWLTKKSGRECRLPTEAEWEYACRAGTQGAFGESNEKEQLDSAGWYLGNAGTGTKPSAQKSANPWGLYDFPGNVWEWCEDWYAPYEEGPQTDPLQTNSALSDKPRRVLRGGSWLRDWQDCRAAARYRNDPQSRNADNGFRVVAAPSELEPVLPRRAPTAPAIAAVPIPTEVESAADQPEVIPSPASEHQPDAETIKRGGSGRMPGGSIWSGFLITIAVGGVLLFVLMRSVLRKHSPIGTEPMANAPSGRPVFTRIAEDGFWIEGDAIRRGAMLLCKYSAGGETKEQQIAFEPGPEGHFIFTGAKPTHVSVIYLDDQNSYNTRSGSSFAPPIKRSPPPRRSSSSFSSHPPAY